MVIEVSHKAFGFRVGSAEVELDTYDKRRHERLQTSPRRVGSQEREVNLIRDVGLAVRVQVLRFVRNRTKEIPLGVQLLCVG